MFLDLNGTLVMPITVDDPNALTAVDDAANAVARLSRAGFLCPVVTIQGGIAKGRFSDDAFRAWFAGFASTLGNQGARLLGPYV